MAGAPRSGFQVRCTRLTVAGSWFTRDGLLRYCERDTWAMVKLLERLRGLVADQRSPFWPGLSARPFSDSSSLSADRTALAWPRSVLRYTSWVLLPRTTRYSRAP